MTSTNWYDALSVPRFDPALGTLDHIDLTLNGHLESMVQFESFDVAPTTISTNIYSVITVQRPDASTLTVATPSAGRSDDVTSYDGVFDFDGGSGRTYTLTADLSSSSTLSDSADLTLFTGLGDIGLPITAEATSDAGGAGSFTALLSTSASAEASVTYNYTPIPAPSAILLGSMGLACVGWVKRRFR